MIETITAITPLLHLPPNFEQLKKWGGKGKNIVTNN